MGAYTTNIVTAEFLRDRRTVSRSLYQWDYGQTLQIIGITLPAAYEVHFADCEYSADSITQIGDADGVHIPDELLLTGKHIFAWIYLHTGEEDGETRYVIEIPVKKRAKPTNAEPTPVEQDEITQAIAALNAAVEQTAEDVIATGTSAAAAEDAADRAASSAESAAASDESAGASEASAADSAENAGLSADAAAESATSAAGSADEAEASSLTSEAYAKGTRNGSDVSSSDPAYHNNSKYYAEQAEGYADSAGTSASTATDKAGEASASAASASASATTASTKAGEAASSATQAASSASAAGTSETNAAASAGTASTAATNAASSATAAQTAQTAAETAQGKAEDAQEAAEEAMSTKVDKPKRYVIISDPITAGSYFRNGSIVQTVGWKYTKASVTPGQKYKIKASGNGYVYAYYFCNGTTVVDHSAETAFTEYIDTEVIAPTGCDTLYVNVNSGNASHTITECEISSVTIVNVDMADVLEDIADKAPVISTSLSGSVVTFDDGADDMPLKSLTVGIDYVQSGTGDPSPTNVRPISGWTGANIYTSGADTSNPTVYPITFPASAGTVYGGTLDVKSGVLTVNTVMVEYDGSSDEAWTPHGTDSQTKYFEIAATGAVSAASGGKAVCNRYTNVSIGTGNQNIGINVVNNAIRLRYVLDNTQTADDCRAFVAANNLQVIYSIATPITYTLTPTDIHTLLGDNSIWADTGDVSVEYCADTKKYVGDTFVKKTDYASSADIKAGTEQEKYIAPVNQDASAFYALAKAAGDTTQSASSNAVGTYTEDAKRAICAMIGVPYDEPFRLIKEITITEETRYVNILTDESSSALSLTEAIVCLDNMVATGSGTAYIVANQDPSASITAATPVLNIPNVYYTSARSTMAHIETRGGRFFGRGLDNVPENYSRSNITSSRNAFGVALCNRITRIGIRSSNDHKFTSGKITVYGR